MLLQGMDTHSNILYVQENFPALSHLAHRTAATDKYRPETCCIIGNYYSLKAQHEKVSLYMSCATVTTNITACRCAFGCKDTGAELVWLAPCKLQAVVGKLPSTTQNHNAALCLAIWYSCMSNDKLRQQCVKRWQ